MKPITNYLLFAAMAALVAASFVTSCTGNKDFLSESKKLAIELIDSKSSGGTGGTTPGETGEEPGQVVPGTSPNAYHPIFQGEPGVPVNALSLGAIDPDPTGHTICDDYDGDGIPNSEEITNNQYVADYPHVVTGISGAITMEIRVWETSLKENFTENVEFTEDNSTLKNSMEDWHYNQLNTKTTPYVSKEAYEADETDYSSYSSYFGFGQDHSKSFRFAASGQYGGTGGSADTSGSKAWGYSIGAGSSSETAHRLLVSTMSEKTVFPTIDHIDNLDRNGQYFTSDNVRNITENYRSSDTIKSTQEYGANAGVVVASLYIKNLSVNIPVRVSNIMCTLSFRTPAGEFLSVKTFRLRNDDWTIYEQDIGGNDVFGPFTVEVTDINTADMKRALANAYIPQIEVISYDMRPVLNSNYHPGVDNLKIVEETAKGRTAQINIIGKNRRESFRVCAFDVNGTSISPGISLKKALFNILKNRFRNDNWNDSDLTVRDASQWWKSGAAEHLFTAGKNGNEWDRFETHIKTYKTTEKMPDGSMAEVEHKIETIKKIWDLEKYNPFSIEDNRSFNENERLSETELKKMQYWFILHNGEYFTGDINDPIWVGEKYDIIFFSADDFRNHYQDYIYTPLQAGDTGYLATSWNRLSNQGDFPRALYMGKLIKGDVVKLELDLAEYRSLFDPASEGVEFGGYGVNSSVINAPLWHDFRYSFEGEATLPNGIPQEFTHEAWGRCNQIGLKINESDKAHYYKVSVWKTSESETAARIVHVTPDMLKENQGYVYINRHSLSQGGPGTIGPLDAANYNVKVRAYGKSGEVTVSRLSSTVISTVTVEDPQTTDLPEKARYSLYGSVNELRVSISEPGGSLRPAEYYRIRVYGPANYGNGNNVEFAPLYKDFAGHAGVNIIPAPNGANFGTGLTSREQLLDDPGVFRVEVYSVNKNNIDPGTGADILGPETLAEATLDMIEVPYERYGEQKKNVAALRNDLFEPRDVDLEVNFNEGSGWFKLRLSYDDWDINDRVIECALTSNFDYRNKKVTIYFEPPAGSLSPQNPYYNVFSGNRDEVDLYLRTVAQPKYRDTLWLKPNDEKNLILGRSRFMAINATEEGLPTVNVLPDYDVYQYWTQNEHTDATAIEDYNLGGERITTYFDNGDPDNETNNVDLTSIPDRDFRVAVKESNDARNDFFFSPVKHAVFAVKGTLVSENIAAMMAESNHADAPLCRVVPGDRAIYVSGIDSRYAESFRVSWRKGTPARNDENLDTAPWSSEIIPVSSNKHYSEILQAWDKHPVNGTDEFVDLKPNQVYTVCITASNSMPTQSNRVYRQVKTIPMVEEHRLVDPGYYANGYGSFADPAAALTNNLGSIFTEGVDFAYGQQMTNLYDDTGTSGEFSPGRYVRIVHNGQNLTSLGLTPYACDLAQIVSPPGDRFYIDPLRGTFALPRPVYWSRLNTISDITQPDIKLSPYAPSYSYTDGNFAFAGGKFGGCLNQGAVYSGGAIYFYIYPFSTSPPDFPQGTASFYLRMYRYGAEYMCQSTFYISNNAYIHIALDYWTCPGATVSIVIYGSTVASAHIEDIFPWNHFYIVWDNQAGLTGGNSIRVFANNVPICSSTASFSGTYRLYYLTGINGTSRSFTDNLKIWNHVVSEDPSWEYNSGNGREDALHSIYGPASNYKPVLVKSNDGDPDNDGGVGFWAVPKW
ncbi:MAG: hypothetical protein A2W19_01175 [Spirochaetes bacterium RBG_16_49_21]|nr:MAG: hypothetical protein A2W19_01175 [Spirochaetes bacterium RBG_16_49_21]